VLAKVTRDRIMCDLHERMPWYGFGEHKGYCTAEHNASLLVHGPSAEHRFGYVNVALAVRAHGLSTPPHRTARAGPWSIVRPAVVQNGDSPTM
ncbi:MAG TPA: ribonuclease HII, partial [Pseudonocardiaceae bacterium]|nr:ribonuclease HII [Pseudonocardiaceae bacterium]